MHDESAITDDSVVGKHTSSVMPKCDGLWAVMFARAICDGDYSHATIDLNLGKVK